MNDIRILRLKLGQVQPDPGQPRKTFDPDDLRSLANSIQASGLLQPITVRSGKRKDQYIIIAGERRYRAHLLLKRSHIEARVMRDLDALQVRALQIAENAERKDINPVEEAMAYQALLDDGYTLEQVVKASGKEGWVIGWRLSLLRLAPNLRSLLVSGQLDRQTGLELARLETQHDQDHVLRMVVSGKLIGWKAVRNAVDAILNGTTQSELFGSAKATAEELETLTTMERKIERVQAMVATGWKDGDCLIANKVNPDRACLMADRIGAIRSALVRMERDLRNMHATAIIAMDYQKGHSHVQ